MYVSYQLLINDLFLVGTLDPYSNGTWFNSAQIAKMFELFLFLFTYCLDNFRAEDSYFVLHTNPLRQTVIKFDLPDSWIPPEVLDNFRAEDEAARLFFLNNPPR